VTSISPCHGTETDTTFCLTEKAKIKKNKKQKLNTMPFFFKKFYTNIQTRRKL